MLESNNNNSNNSNNKGQTSPDSLTGIKINFTPVTSSNTASASQVNNTLSGGSAPLKTSNSGSSTSSNSSTFIDLGSKNSLNDSKNDFKPTSKLDLGAPTLVDNIASQKAPNPANNLKNILGNSAILEKSLQEEQELKLKKKLRLLQSVFVSFFLAFTIVQGFFFSQLNPGLNMLNLYSFQFDQNLTHKLTDLNKNFRSVQSLINKYHYLTAQLHLNQFSFLSGKYLDGVKSLKEGSQAENRTRVLAELDDIKTKLPTLLTDIKKDLLAPITVETFRTSAEEPIVEEDLEASFQTDLTKALNDDKKALNKSQDLTQSTEQIEETKFINNALKLVGNKKLMTTLRGMSAENFQKDLEEYQNGDDAAQQKRFEDSIASLLQSTKIDLATVSTIKNVRIEWSSIIDRIKNITDTANNDHNASTNNGSKFIYSGYEFNADANKIVLSGINTTQSGTNTSVTSNLIDSFESSPFFENVVNRSFPKAKSTGPNGEETFTMNFKIDLGLEKDEFSSKNSPISLTSSTDKPSVKRAN